MVAMDLFEGLNKQQTEAVKYVGGPLLILAGPGSGKTRTLTHRIAYLISNEGVRPNQILAVTFTNKAAGEMRSRVAKLLGKAEDDRSFMPFLGTFHAICVRILREDADYLEISKQFVIFDADDAKNTVAKVLKEQRVNVKQFAPRMIASIISSNKNEMVTPEEYGEYAAGPTQKIVATAYPRYQEMLEESAALDFDDLLLKVVELLTKHETVRKKWQKRFKHVMVDEYQDTNGAQYQIAKLLTGSHGNICVVGDDWQSIYSWRGADYRNILNFEKDFKGTKVIKLEQNYRSTQAILDASQSIINKNKSRTKKKIWTDKDGGQPVKIESLRDEIAEGEFIVGKVATEVDIGARAYSDFAVLYRTNAQSRSLEEVFLRYQVPYQIIGGVRFYERKEIKDVVAYLRLLYQPDDAASFARIINVPARGIGSTSLLKFDTWRTGNKLSLSAGLAKANEIPVGPKQKQAFIDFADTLKKLRKYSLEVNASTLIEATLKRTDYLAYLDDGSVSSEDRIANVKELISVAREYEETGIGSFLEEVALASDVDSLNTKDSVKLMTLHSAKGLEFPVVFIAGMEESLFPHSRALFDVEEMEEERRLCYVGMTRAQEELYLLHVSRRLLYGSVNHNPPSRFIAEVDSSYTANEPFEQISNQPAYEDIDQTQVEVNVGDEVEHHAFGAGVIEKLEGDVVIINFKSSGKKRLNTAFANLRKL